MKRIAIYYDGQRIARRNDGNPLYVWNNLKKREGLEVDNLAPTGDLSKFGQYDLHLWVDWGEDGLQIPYDIIYPPGRPLAYWASDTHLGYDYRLKRALAADYVFAAQIEAVRDFRRDGVKDPILLPHAFEPLAYPKIEVAAKEYDVCFVGHINSENRIAALDALFKAFPNFYYGQRRFEEAAEKFAKSKVCFNISMKQELNMRVFEVMGSGNFLLTDDIPMIHNYFQDGVHCVLYKDEKEMIEKARYYLDHDDERERIAEAGYQECLNHHLISQRVDKILTTAGLLLLTP
jgi:glycosyltransferase involved in cell wall biosynthesis